MTPPAFAHISEAFVFHANEPGGTFTCSVNGAAAMPCTSPAAPATASGQTTVVITAIDAAGNVDPTPVSHTFRTAVIALPDSQAATCTDGAMEITCPLFGPTAGQDGNYAYFPPVYAVTADTVTDQRTGLVWERNAATPKYTYQVALDYCTVQAAANFGGISTWRIPNRFEMLTIVDAGRKSDPVPVELGSVPQNSRFWTSTMSVADGSSAWTIGTNYVVFEPQLKTNTHLVRCVSGPELTTGTFQALPGGLSILDTATGLIWQSTITAPSVTWTGALTHCEGLPYDGKLDWRLPTIKDLASLVDSAHTAPALDPVFAASNAALWSSTPTPNGGTSAYDVEFATGVTDSNLTSSLRGARCVR